MTGVSISTHPAEDTKGVNLIIRNILQMIFYCSFLYGLDGRQNCTTDKGSNCGCVSKYQQRVFQ